MAEWLTGPVCGATLPPLLSSFVHILPGNDEKTKNFKYRPELPLTCCLNRVPGQQNRTGQKKYPSADIGETLPLNLFLNSEHLLESYFPLHMDICFMVSTPWVKFEDTVCLGKEHHLFDCPRFTPGMQAYFQISFLSYLHWNCSAILYIAREAAGWK